MRVVAMSKTMSDNDAIEMRKDVDLLPLMMGCNSAVISSCPEGPGRFRRLLRCTAAAGAWVRAHRSQTGGRISRRAAYALFTISYRLAAKGEKTYPQAVNDVSPRSSSCAARPRRSTSIRGASR